MQCQLVLGFFPSGDHGNYCVFSPFQHQLHVETAKQNPSLLDFFLLLHQLTTPKLGGIVEIQMPVVMVALVTPLMVPVIGAVMAPSEGCPIIPASVGCPVILASGVVVVAVAAASELAE